MGLRPVAPQETVYLMFPGTRWAIRQPNRSLAPAGDGRWRFASDRPAPSVLRECALRRRRVLRPSAT